MIERENKQANDLFFTCSLIEYIARKTKNKRSYIVDKLGKNNIKKIYELAEVYHSDNIDKVSEDFIKESHIQDGSFDNVKECKYTVPSHWDIGKVYRRLIFNVEKEKNINLIDALFEVYHSFVSDLIQDYNGSFYYENPETILSTYLTGIIE